MTYTVLFLVSMAVLFGMASPYCSYKKDDSAVNTTDERKTILACLNESDDMKSWNDSKVACEEEGASLIDVETLFEHIDAIDHHEYWIDYHVCSYLKDGNLNKGDCSAERNYVCKMSSLISQTNWCSNVHLKKMSYISRNEICNYFGGRLVTLTPVEMNDLQLPDSVKWPSYPTWIDTNVDGECLLITNPDRPEGMKCVDQYKTYTTSHTVLHLKFHHESVDWVTAKSICTSEGGHLMVINSWKRKDALTETLLAEGEYAEWWVTNRSYCTSIKVHPKYIKGHAKYDNCRKPKKFICESLR